MVQRTQVTPIMSTEENKTDNQENDALGQDMFRTEILEDIYESDEPALDPIYRAKARILNDALQDIGMGKYQASFNFITP